jgi:hypothetical protein
VVDWPEDTDDQAALKHIILEASCRVLLYTGKSADPFSPGSFGPDDITHSVDLGADGTLAGAGSTTSGDAGGMPCAWLRAQFARLARAIDEEFGGFSVACCLGRKPAAGPPATMKEIGDVGAGEAKPPHGWQRRVEHVRNGAEGPLDTEEAGRRQSGEGLVTVMIAGLGRPAEGKPADNVAPSQASAADVETIFRALGVSNTASAPLSRSRSARASPHIGPRTRSGRIFAPILISQQGNASPAATGDSETSHVATADLQWGDPAPDCTLPPLAAGPLLGRGNSMHSCSIHSCDSDALPGDK